MMRLLAAAPPGGIAWIEAALLLFFVVFLLITIRVVLRRPGHFDAAARIPLEEAPVEERMS